MDGDFVKTAGNSDKRRNREAEVVAAAIDVFFDKGYTSASIQEVADKVGMLKGSLYYYIDSKEDLLWKIVDDVHHQWMEIFRGVESMDADAIDKIRTYIDRHVEWYLANVREVSVFFREWRALSGERRERAMRRRQGYERVIRDLIIEARGDGDVDESVDPKYASFFILAAVNAVPDWYRERGPDPPRVIAEQYANMTVGLLRGTRPRAGVS